MNLLVPALISELVCDTLLLVSVWRSWLLCIIPWLLLNIMFILGLGASVIYLLALLIISQSDDDMEIIRNLLFVIILNMFFVMNTIHLNGVVQVFMDTKTRNMLEVLSEKSKVVMPALDQDNSCSSLINHEVKLEEEGASFPDESLQETENISHLGHVEQDSSFDSFHYDDIP